LQSSFPPPTLQYVAATRVETRLTSLDGRQSRQLKLHHQGSVPRAGVFCSSTETETRLMCGVLITCMRCRRNHRISHNRGILTNKARNQP
jgi:hypothetical protein